MAKSLGKQFAWCTHLLNKSEFIFLHRFKIKSQYAFGTKGNEQFNIPPKAKVEYTIKLNDCEKPIDIWKYSKAERLEHAKIFKEKGTKYFKKENYSLAITMYFKCVDLLALQNGKSFDI